MAVQVRDVQVRLIQARPIQAGTIKIKTESEGLTFGVDSLTFNGEQLTYGV